MKGTGAPQRDRGGFAEMRGVLARTRRANLRSIGRSIVASDDGRKRRFSFTFGTNLSPVKSDILPHERTSVAATNDDGSARHWQVVREQQLSSITTMFFLFFSFESSHLFACRRSIRRSCPRASSRPKTPVAGVVRICSPSKFIPSNPPLPKASQARLSGNTSNP